MADAANTSDTLITDAQRLVAGLFRPSPLIYWVDFLISWAVGLSALLLAWLVTPRWSLWQVAAVIVSALAYYRAVLFIHELTHLKAGTFTAFRAAWNMLCGIPACLPSFTYYTHRDHHRRRDYGTDRDGEYVPLARQPRIAILVQLVSCLFVPFAGVIRFGVLSPISWLCPPLGRLVYRRASSLVMDIGYIRPDSDARTMRVVRLQEALCFVWLVAAIALPRVVLGHWPIELFAIVYAVAVLGATVNMVRTLGAHRWHNAGDEMTMVEQFEDTLNYPHRPWVTTLWGPIGLRFHALHHLFPAIPYHNLGKAHRILARDLPADSPYHTATRTTLIGSIITLWREAGSRATREAPKQPGDVRKSGIAG